MSQLSLEDLRLKVGAITSKRDSDITSEDMNVIAEYLQREDPLPGVSDEMLNFISTPEQQAVTRAMLERNHP